MRLIITGIARATIYEDENALKIEEDISCNLHMLLARDPQKNKTYCRLRICFVFFG